MSQEPVPMTPGPASVAAGGATKLSALAVARVAAAAASTVPQVHSLGGGASRTLGAIRGAVGGAEGVPGVSVELGSHQVAVDIVLTSIFGTNLHEVADAVRREVYRQVHQLTDLEVIEVNIEVGDVYVPAPQVQP